MYKYLAVTIALLAIGYFIFDYGRDWERDIWINKQTESAELDIEIEKEQNEIRNTIITDPDLDRILQSGRFGQL